MAIPKFFEFFVPVLKVLNDADHEVRSRALFEAICQGLEISEEEQKMMLPSGKQPVYANRIHWAISYLKAAGLIETVLRGTYQITDLGKKVYKQDKEKISLAYLNRFESFVKFHGGKTVKKTDDAKMLEMISTQVTPIESIQEAYKQIQLQLASTLLQAIMANTPSFFEHLVVDLVIAMGYGYDKEKAGVVTGKVGDEGIDGIISEDKLGFSRIYLQAKRWNADNVVRRADVQAFVGALLVKGATKGLFITTSHFTKDAIKYAEDLKDRSIILVDGNTLARLMIDHNIGVSTQQTFVIKKIDNDYFDE